MRFYILGFICALLLAAPAAAQTWSNCTDGAQNYPAMTITKYDLTCLDWDNDNEVDAIIARQFNVRAKSALFCFDPNILDEAADVAQVTLMLCPGGSVPAANPELQCIALTNAAMTGLPGAPGTQDACLRIGPGAYTIIQTVAPDAADLPRVTIQGEGD